MRVRITRNEKELYQYVADCIDLPGSPPVGRGTTREKATINLMYMLFMDTHCNWRQYISDYDNGIVHVEDEYGEIKYVR